MEIKIYYTALGNKILMGLLTQKKNGKIYFQYDKDFLKQFGNISPKGLTNSLNYQGPFPDFLDFLPGIVHDCLPDGWGRLVMDRFIEKEFNIKREEAHIFLKLLLLDDNAIGGLSFESDENIQVNKKELPDLSSIYSIIKDFYVNTDTDHEDLKSLLLASASLNGARPKILCYYRNDNGHIQISNNYFDDSEPYIVKFISDTDSKHSVILEYLYMSFAKQLWEDTPNVELIEVEKGTYALAIKRFDRIKTNEGFQKVMVHSLAGALHANFRTPNFNYDGFIKMTGFLTQSYTEVELAFERSVFNIVFGNKDDHTKNFSYVFTDDKRWILSPAYDLTLNNGLNGHHQMDVFGKTDDITKSDLIQLAIANDIKNPEEIIDKIVNVYSEMITYTKNNYNDKIPKDVISYMEDNLKKWK